MATTKKRKVDQEEVEGEEEEKVDYEVSEEQHSLHNPHHLADFPPGGGPTEEGTEEEDEDIAKLLEPLSRDQLISILRSAASSDPNTLAEIHRLADLDPSHRKIFVHGLNWSTTADTLQSFFSQFGEIDDCRVVSDRSTGKSKGYGFVLFRHRRSARRALRSPQNLIDGRMTACQLASVGPTAPQQGQPPSMPQHQQVPAAETLSRKIYVGNVHSGIDGSRLREFFASYGEIEEGPLGFDRQTGKPKGFALFIYQTVEGARKALEEPNKNFDGHMLHCQRATDGHKFKGAATTPAASVALGSGGFNAAGSAGYNAPGNAGAFNGVADMGLAQGILGAPLQFGQGMQANAAALAMLAAAGQNPAAFGVSPALIASLNPALAAAMSGGAPQMAMQAPVPSQGYGMGNAGYQNAGYQGPSPPVNQGNVPYQGAPMGQSPAARPPMGPMGGYGPH